jgi:anti-anti-sigma factor
MKPVVHFAGLEIDQLDDTALIRFTDGLRDDANMRETASMLRQLVEEDQCYNLVLNFGDVLYVPSFMLGLLFRLCQQIEANGGRLAFCNVSPFLEEVLDVVRLPQFVPIYVDEEEALNSFASQVSVGTSLAGVT